jgi:hypothetical protein
MSSRFAVPLVTTLLVISAAASHAQDSPALAGQWVLNRELSQDIEARIKEAAGSQYMANAGSWAADTWIPWGGTKLSEGQRIEVRELLLAAVPALQRLEIELSPSEIKTIHGQDGVRIFNLTRTSAGTSVVTGEKVARQARWQGQQLLLDSKGKDSHLTEIITPVPARRQLTYALRFEAKLLEKPLEVSMAYDRASGEKR